MQYEWKDRLMVALKNGISLSAEVDPNVVGSVLEKIKAENNGEVRPRDLVEKSRSKRSPTHKMFEWDDAIASEKYRVEQARYAIRTLDVVYESTPGIKTDPAMVSVTSKFDSREPVYVSLPDAMEDDDWRDQVLMKALSGLRQWRQKWHRLNELAEAAAAVKQVDKAINVLMDVASK